MPIESASPQHRVELVIGDTTTTLRVTRSGVEIHRTELGIGQMNVRPGPFKSEPPTPLELETAIEVVENHLMPRVRDMPVQAELVARAQGQDLRTTIEAAAGLALPDPMGLDQVETAFSHVVSLASGAAFRADDPMRDRRFAAALLILREWMHHGGFAHVRLP